jgi:hypothetical protein
MARQMARPWLAAAVVALAAAAGNTWAQVAAGAAVLPAPATEAMHEHITSKGDTLIGLGKRYLVNPQAWPELAKANALRNPNQIPTGTTVRIPLRLMQTEAVPATLVHVQGQAQSAGAALQAGQAVAEGSELNTGADGHVTVRLVDGTLLRLRPASKLLVQQSRRLRDAGGTLTGTRLEQGRVEIEAAPAAAGRPGFRIDTPQGVLGVRGTEFRVTADAADGATRGEVLGGAVVFEGRQGGATERVSAGFGTVIAANGQVAAPVRLLGAPTLAGLPSLQERLLMRFALPPLPGAAAYRAQISADASFDRVLADLTSATPELRFAELPDGDYVLRVRAVDARGLEGQDADHPFRLKARPEAPLPAAPVPRAVIFGAKADLAWAANAQAQRYRMRLVRIAPLTAAAASTTPTTPATPPTAAPAPRPITSADFGTPLRDLKDLPGLSTTLEGLAPGVYHWQLASVRAGDDQGPWGEPRSFEMRPLPPEPRPPAVGDRSISFGWEGLPGQTFEFQLARDTEFKTLLLTRQLTEPAFELPLPGTGRFFVRLRARDADGFQGPFTTPQYFDIANCVRDSSGSCVRAGGQTLNLTP